VPEVTGSSPVPPTAPILARSGLARPYPDRVDLVFSGEIWFWKGPSPFHFVTVPPSECRQLKAASAAVTYGWGMIPVEVSIGDTTWTTSLWPKDGRYVVPLKDWVRGAEGLQLGDEVTVRLSVEV
jgi:uncharacterized protein DUF1905